MEFSIAGNPDDFFPVNVSTNPYSLDYSLKILFRLISIRRKNHLLMFQSRASLILKATHQSSIPPNLPY